MRTFNQSKTKELTDLSLCTDEIGYFMEDVLTTYHEATKEKEEEGHYETIAEYPNGGKDVVWVVDKPKVEAKDAWEEEEVIQVFIEYTEEERITNKKLEVIDILKKALTDTDYKIIKYYEGVLSDDEYYTIRNHRKHWRKNINRLEQEQLTLEEIEQMTKDDFYSHESVFTEITGKELKVAMDEAD